MEKWSIEGSKKRKLVFGWIKRTYTKGVGFDVRGTAHIYNKKDEILMNI